MAGRLPSSRGVHGRTLASIPKDRSGDSAICDDSSELVGAEWLEIPLRLLHPIEDGAQNPDDYANVFQHLQTVDEARRCSGDAGSPQPYLHLA